ncbi:MAG: hypothetical protein ACX94A_14275, partial [Algiphilus sp.]
VMSAVSLGGALLALLIAFGVGVPRLLRLMHGLAAAGTLALLAVANSVQEAPSLAWWALGVWTAGLLGGLLFFRLLFPGQPPRVLMFAHGVVGLIGLALLYPVAFAGA